MTKLFWRRSFLSVFALLAVFAFAVACGDDDDGDDTSPGATATTGTQGQAPKGTITVRTIQFESWDPHFSDFSQDIDHFYKVWRGLYEFDKDDKPVPIMAEGAPTIGDGGKTYTVKLKKDLKWSDGQPLTAEDFVLGLQRSCNYAVASHYQYILTAVVGCDAYYDAKNKDKTPADIETLKKGVGVRAIDATTIEYKLADPLPTFPTLLGMWPTFPAPKHKVTAVDAKWPAPMENVYNGPFLVKAYTEKDRIELGVNPNWAGKDKPKVEKIIIRYIDDAAVAETAYRAGEIDITAANTSTLDATRKDPTLSKELLSYPSPTTIGLQFQLEKPVWAKPEVRLAFSQATDRKTLNDVVLKGANIPTTHWMPPAFTSAQGSFDATLGFDVAKAKANMTKAGFQDGKGFPSFTLLLTDSATNKAVGEFLQSEWKKHLGVDIKLEFTDSKTRSSRFNSGDYEMVLGGWHQDYGDPENWMLGLYETGGSINKTKTSVAALDALLKQAKFNQNDEQRRQQYKDAEKLLLEGAHGIVPIYYRANHFLIKPHIKGVGENKSTNDSQMPAAWHPEYWSTTKG